MPERPTKNACHLTLASPRRRRGAVVLTLFVVQALSAHAEPLAAPAPIEAAEFKELIDSFNAQDESTVVNAVANDDAFEWIAANVPRFECPSPQFTATYYYRWWCYRKHLKATPQGTVVTEFLTPVSHAGPYNTISCAFGHHLAEGRWLRDQRFLDEYARYWFCGGQGEQPVKHFHQFSSWAAAALYDRYLITGDGSLLVDLLDELIADYAAWEAERRTSSGLFWQYDVRDGMEESISGSRTEQHLRPTINSYMAANALAISKIARLAGRSDDAARYAAKSEELAKSLRAELWDADAQFFKVKLASGRFSDAGGDRLLALDVRPRLLRARRGVATITRSSGVSRSPRHHDRRTPPPGVPIARRRHV